MPEESAKPDQPSEPGGEFLAAELAAVIALLGFVATLAAGGFAISTPVGFFCLAAGLLVTALLLGWVKDSDKPVTYTYVEPDKFRGGR